MQVPAEVVSQLQEAAPDAASRVPSSSPVDAASADYEEFAAALSRGDWREHRLVTAVHVALLTVLLKQFGKAAPDSDADSDSDGELASAKNVCVVSVF